MAKRKERALTELYNVTRIVTEPEITPVLRGSCRMQGPVDETDYDIQSNTVSSRGDKGSTRCSRSQKFHVRAESGTCNVCSAPCSSCLHINRPLMGSKTDDSSDETCRENPHSYSVNDVVSSVNSRKCEVGQHPASETSNLVSLNSTHDCFSENAESKANVRTFNLSGASEDVEMLSKFSSAGTSREDLHTLKSQYDSHQITLTNKFHDPKGLEGHDDNISCISRANEANKLSSYDTGNVDKVKTPCSASNTSLISEGCGDTIHFQTASGGLDIKCDVEGSQNNSSRRSQYTEESFQKVSPISLSTELSSLNLGLLEISSLKDTDDGAGSLNVRSGDSHSSGVKSLSCNLDLKNSDPSKEYSCSCLQGELPECSREHLNSLTMKEEVSHIACGKKPASYNCDDIQNGKLSLIGKSLGAKTGNGAGDPPAEALNSLEQNEVLHDAKETSLNSYPVDESDESDIVEHDVKVCDICGDAGREDLLAICCRCSDGAEHTYCMREMLDKVPEGDWLCEECKFDEEIKMHKQDRFGTVDGNEKIQSSALAGTENTSICLKLDTKGSDTEGNRTNKDRSSAKVSGKRHADDSEVSSTAKKQVLEPIIGSSKMSSPSRVAALSCDGSFRNLDRGNALSRDGSFRNLDRGKVKLAHQFSSGTHSTNDSPETACSPTTGPLLQTPRGTFSKSKSFNFSNVKPKVKLVDEVVPQKQKLGREPASLDTKEGAVRLIGKSMSFKSANSNRLNTCESKVKMLSPKFPLVQDLKGLKQRKDRNLFERKNSLKSEHSLVNSAVANSAMSTKVDQKVTSRAKTISLSSVSNNHEPKAAQSDSKSITLSKPTSYITRRSSEIPVTLGEVKKQLSCSDSVVGSSSANGISSPAEQKPIQASSKDDSSSSSCVADRPLCNVIESPSDGLPWPQEITNLGERIKESSGNRPRQSITAGGRSVTCQKCKEVGHFAQFCTVDSPRLLAVDASSARHSREDMNKGNKLKAAIEAAMLKKPGIYRKNRPPNQSDELSASSMTSGIAWQDQLSSSSNAKSMMFAEEVHEGHAIPQNPTSESCKQTTLNNAKQFLALPSEAGTSRVGDASPIVPSDGKPATGDLLSHALPAMPTFLKISAIPEHEYIWQGGFEVHMSRRIPDSCDGIQAHLSTCASPKVLEVVNKFPRKVLLNEVPRLSTWPVQFQESGVREDNIALYFFAKDIESYEKGYKILLESMMRNDVALKGDIDGVELLIFASNQLPDKSQRWNMLFFLWGVFRGKRVNGSQDLPGSPNKLSIPQDIPPAITALPENICSLGPIDNGLPTCERPCNVAIESKAPASVELPSLSSSEVINGDCDAKLSSIIPKGKLVQINGELQDCRLDCNSLSVLQTSTVLSCPEMRSTGTSLEGLVDSDCKPDAELEASLQATRTINGSNRSEKMPLHWATAFVRQQSSSHYFDKVPAALQEVASMSSIGEENIADRTNNSKDQVKFTRNLKEDGPLDAEATLVRETVMADPTMKELNSQHLNHKKRPQVDPSGTTSAGTSRTIPWNDVNSLASGGNASKKQKTGLGGFYGCSDYTSSSRDAFASRLHDGGSGSPIKEKRCNESCDEVAFPKNMGNAERYFFPVDPNPVKDIGLGDNSVPWTDFSYNEDWLHDGAPNLELALGAETKPAKQGIPSFLVGKVDKKINQDVPPDKASTKEEEDVSASLSLSLSFPAFPDKECTVTPAQKTEQLLPGRRHVNTSLLLFGGFPDK